MEEMTGGVQRTQAAPTLYTQHTYRGTRPDILNADWLKSIISLEVMYFPIERNVH